MLDSLRKASQTWAAKALLLLLVASFGIWGASSSLLTVNAGTVLTVGDQEVSVEDFRFAYQRQLADLGRQFGRQLTSEQARAFGIDRQVMSQLAAGAALDQLSDDMKLGLSKDRLANLIAEDPAFKSVNGQFDRTLFTERLRNAGLRENDYITERSRVAVRSQVVEAVSDGFTPPKVLTDAMSRFRNETRAIDYIVLSNANIDPVKAPADDVLAKWFEGVKARYRAPEYRSFSYVKLEPADIAQPSSITDQEVRAEYEKRKDSYRTPERRVIEQLTFPDKQMAEAAAAQLKERTATFDQLVTDQGKTLSDVRLGEFTRETIPDQKVAPAAFAISTDGGTSPVTEGMFGPVIIRATGIKSGTEKTFDEVKEDIRKSLALSAASREVMNVHDRFEDIRAGGASLEDAAKELNLRSVAVEASDSAGKDMKAAPVRDLPSPQLLGEVFKTDVGSETLPVTVGNDGYVWFEVRSVKPERDRALDEVRTDAVTDWSADQQKAALAAKTDELRKSLQNGGALATIAADLGIAVESKQTIRRGREDAVLGAEAVSAAFSGPLGTVASALGGDGESRILMKVTAVDADAPSDAGEDEQIATIARAAGDDMLDQMVNRLQTDYGVTINQTAADQAIVQ